LLSNIKTVTVVTTVPTVTILLLSVVTIPIAALYAASAAQITIRQAEGHYHPRVEAGWNTSPVVPASRKRRQKGYTISDETVKYGY
jgi:hypothetical protein